VPVKVSPAAADASFIIGGPILFQNGLQCRGDHTLREYAQETADGVTYDQDRWDYDYLPAFGVSDPTLWPLGHSAVTLTWPGDDAAIARGASLTCGTLVP
jgi:hypothetical protein